MTEDRDVVEAALRHRIEVEEVVTSLSTRFLNVADDEIERTIAAALAQLGELFGVDRAYVLRVRGPNGPVSLFEEWWGEHAPRDLTPLADLDVHARRWWVGRLRDAEITHFRTLEDVPVDATEVRDALARDGVCSLLLLPLTSRGQTDGFLGFEARRSARPWSPESIALMRTVGEIFVSALDRARSAAALAAAASELAQRNAELERSNSELETFASIASHDLKAPLRVVRGFLELLDRTAADRLGDDAMGYVRAAQRGAARMEELINDLLAYAQAGRGAGPPMPVDLAAVLGDVVSDAAAAIDDAGATVTTGELPVVLGDETQLRQLCQNLVSNAVKFMREDVTPTLHVRAVRAGSDWLISFADNGIGIAAADRERVFTMFSRLHGQDRYPGTGIGLAVCERVVARHGGRIWAEETPGGGATFVFTLPA